MHNIYLCQPQYTMEVDGLTQYWLPYSVGSLWSYAQQFDWVTENFVLKDLIFQRDTIKLVAEQFENPTLCGFSCYVWNEQYCLSLAEEIKKRWPNCVIVFGGPQTHTDLLKNKFIDVAILNEGEQAFVDILKSVLADTPLQKLYLGNRMENLNIPSPYGSGIFDDIINKHPNATWHMTMETNRGCPYQCTFCDWGSLTYSKIKTFDLTRVEEDIKWAKNHPVSYIYCADANFGIFKERDLQIAKLFNHYLDNSTVEAINLQFAKNSNEDIMEIAKTVGRLCRGVTVSVQSLHDQTLTDIKRKNLKINNMYDIFELSEIYNVKTYSEFILGLPNETLGSWKTGLTDILEYGQHQSIDIWFCQILKNSELASLDSRRKFDIKTINVKDYLALHNKNDTTVTEYIEIITSTNTMPLDDLVEGFMYGWMIINFHIAGYSQIIAKHARTKNISYKDYYDCFFIQIQNSIFRDQFESLKQHIKSYLINGEISLRNVHSVIHTYSAEFIYTNKNLAFDLAFDVFLKLHNSVDYNVLELQKLYLYDQNVCYPITVKIGNLSYSIDSQTKNKFNFYNNRRKGLLKNNIKLLDTT